MGEEPRIGNLKHGDAEHAMIAGLVSMLREAAALAMPSDDVESRLHALSMLMTASGVMAGTIFGEMIYAGVAKQSDTKRAADMVARNFRSGIKAGLAKGARVEKAGGGVGHG